MTTAAAPINAIVYQARNLLNGHRYIGFTTQGLPKRQSQHYKGAHGQQPRYRFQHAMAKYGIENFVFGVLGDFGDDEELAKAYECEAIAAYKPEYNLSYGGDGGSMSEETRAKISRAAMGRPGTHLGKKFSAETRQKMSEAAKGKKRPWAAIKSADTRRKLSASLRGHPNTFKGFPVVCVTTGQVFANAKEAEKFFKLGKGLVSAVVKGRKPAIRGLVFKRIEERE